MKSVLVLGGTGMLGSMVADYLSRVPGLCVTATARTPELVNRAERQLAGVSWKVFHASSPDSRGGLESCGRHDWIINAIGITKPLVRDDNPEQIETAILINSLLPHRIAAIAETSGSRVIQIATDCVYSGRKGAYLETDVHDALDVYGKTKSLGECYVSNTHHLRCSIIGPEPKDFKFLLEWFRRQPAAAEVNGFVNHRWNGITTLQFARICRGIVETAPELPHVQHVVPADDISKAELLRVFARNLGRTDVRIRDVQAASVIDRTLATANANLNKELWRAAGYSGPPSMPEMIAEMAAHDYRLQC
jgi:dTDP-4-dehydrorhamnose reductase